MKIYNLYSVKQIRGNDNAFSRITGLPVRPERYWSKWNDFKLAWLVFVKKADAFVWDENDFPKHN